MQFCKFVCRPCPLCLCLCFSLFVTVFLCLCLCLYLCLCLFISVSLCVWFFVGHLGCRNFSVCSQCGQVTYVLFPYSIYIPFSGFVCRPFLTVIKFVCFFFLCLCLCFVCFCVWVFSFCRCLYLSLFFFLSLFI